MMRTVLTPLTAAAVLLAVACGDSPPTVCGDAIPQQSVFVGEQKSVQICFEDPGGGTLTISASSSDDTKVRAFLRGENVGVAGVGVGEATIKVTATNEANLKAETSFSVMVPNRAPNFVSTLREATVPMNGSIQWNLMGFFEEPDGEAMTFSATSSNNGAVGVTVTDSTAEVSGLSEGQSQITLTATDPHGSAGTGNIDVTVKVPVVLIEDDFNSDASLDDWVWNDTITGAEIDDGYLVVEALNSGFFPLVTQGFGGDAEDWTVDAVLRTTDEDAMAAFWVLTGHSRYEVYAFVMGQGDIGVGAMNWGFAWFDNQQNPPWRVADWSTGTSGAISDFTDVRISVSMTADRATATANGQTLFDREITDDDDYLLNSAEGLALTLWFEESEVGITSSMNSVRVTASEFTESGPAPRAFLGLDRYLAKFGSLKRK